MPNTLNDIFAHLDNAKASRAYETNQERRRKVEEAEHERKVKQAAESAVEKYHVYDDDYDVEDVEEPLVMIPKQNPGTPEARACPCTACSHTTAKLCSVCSCRSCTRTSIRTGRGTHESAALDC